MRAFLFVVLLGCTGQATDTDTDTSTTDTDTGTTPGTCDATETPVSFYCQSALCNLCVDDCPTQSEVLDGHDPCTTGQEYGCCDADTCTDATLGTFDRVTCPDVYGTTFYWFDPATGDLVGHAWSTDYNGFCDYESFGELFGLDLLGCE